MRRLRASGEVFIGDKPLGLATYDMLDMSTSRYRAADGTIEFDEPADFNELHGATLTFRFPSGATFKLVVTGIKNGVISVASDGDLPGL